MTRWRLGRRLGAGGMAEVLLAEAAGDDGVTVLAAVKRLLPDGRDDPELRRRLREEERLVRRLGHPHIVALLDAYDDDGRRHLVFEHVDGLTAEALVMRGAGGAFLPVGAAARLASAAASGLLHAHRLGILHRDVSGANLLVSWTGDVKLADFGLADGGDGPNLTAPGTVLGTAAYLSPRRQRGLPATEADDLWALGVVMERLLSAVDPRQRREPPALRLRESAAALRGGGRDALEGLARLEGDGEPLRGHLAKLGRPAPVTRAAHSWGDLGGTTVPEGPLRRRS
jgi:serine/threonine protein kinase